MSDCVFCSIISGDIPNFTIYEDNSSLAFLDITPHTKGHTVVIPKTHAVYLWDLSAEDISSLFFAVEKTMKRLDSILHPDGFSVGWNHGEAGGQAVPHIHVHIMPRWDGDGGGNMHSIISNSGDIAVEEVAKLFS
ncbi:MAG: HIT family protein [Candidatus Magasanikbacteria bacterium]|jgi:histidine triad (HIT) family protein|nr:HIT family protein [Candidatus Magasanikbacteria bacterium]MBT4071485.1 HIT family protein [Candidatus Magasanikbacteria bacterium]